MTVQKEKIQYIDPRKLKVPPVRITTQWESDDEESLGTDIEKYGVEDPLKIADDGTDLWIVDGKHRQEQALLKGLPTVPCIVRQMDLKTQLLRNLASNHLRGTVKVSDEIRVVRELMAAHNSNSDEIASKSGLSRERVETMMLIAAGHTDIIAFLDDGRIKLGHAKAIVRIPDLQTQSQLCYLVQQHGITVGNIDQIVRMTIETIEEQKNPQRSVTNPTSPAVPTVECGCCHQDIHVRHAVSVILCPGCHGVLMAGAQYAAKLDEQPVQSDTKVEESVTESHE
jgi:ParB family chromosome partitioning protein